MTFGKSLCAAAWLGTTMLWSPWAMAQQDQSGVAATRSLEEAFRDPPAEARPRVWWHWMNGNVSREGIARDMAWMKAVGIGGLQNFDANLATPQVVARRLVYMTPEWKDAFRFAATEADRLGLELAIAASPGWSETGGPWVTPADGMKKLVWSESLIPGGKRFTGILPAAPDTTGPFQTAPFAEELPGQDGHANDKPRASGAVAVLAVPVQYAALPPATYTLADGSALAAASLTDADLGTVQQVPLAADLSAEVHIRYPGDVTLRAARLFIPGIKLPFRGVPIKAALEVNEGGIWRHMADVALTSVPSTTAFAPTTGKLFRLRMAASDDNGNLDLLNAAPGAIAINFFDTGPLTSVKIADLQLFAEPRIDRVEEKAGYETVLDYHAIASSDAATAAPPATAVIDLTDRVRPDGSLDWTAPWGSDWRVMRFGWSLTGKTNHPATPEATGLEVDKFDSAAVRRYLETYIGMYRDTVGADLVGKRGIRALLTDSIEVGKANWTGAMEAEFAARRGYALRPWLPALTGLVIGSPMQTERFLFDFRQTLAELMADRHYATVARVAHENGMIVYGEALEDKRPLLGDDLAMRRHADVPMAAMWTYADQRQLRTTLVGDMRGAASVAHVYGKPFVAAESLTSVNAPWDFTPATLKKVIDLEFASGINRPVIHTSVHQPSDEKQPGLSLAIFGQYFNRHESWAGLARPWVDYIARTSYLLQQGRNVADVAWFIGEESPVTALYADRIPDNLPSANAWDFINADMLANALTVDGGGLTTPGGARYRAIYLGGTSARMTLPTLRRLADLVRAGATLIGMRPSGSPAAQDDPAAFAALAGALWNGDVGKGRVVATSVIDAGLAEAGIAPDFTVAGADAEVMFVHRQRDDADLWFVNNRKDAESRVEARFRITGKQPELWHAETGAIEPLPYRIEGGVTVVPMTLAAQDAVFVVFRKPATAASSSLAPPQPVALAEVSGPWQVTFQPGRGAPVSITLDRLATLGNHTDPAVRYFSGEATYSNRFMLPRGIKPGQPLWIDLGALGDVAEVSVNGKPAGYAWHAPYRVNISALVKPGANTLHVRVANRWVNRMIGDAQPGAEKISFTTVPTYRADAPLRPSGLIGPVQLMVAGQ